MTSLVSFTSISPAGSPRIGSPRVVDLDTDLWPVLPFSEPADSGNTGDAFGFKDAPSAGSKRRPLRCESMLALAKTGSFLVSPSRLRTVRKLGEGGFGSVELCRLEGAQKSAEGRLVAVKSVRPELIQDLQDLQGFIDECDTLRRLRHQNLVAFIGVGSNRAGSPEQELKSLFMVQEYVPGGSLRSLLLEQGISQRPLYSFVQALDICRGIASALDYLHMLSPAVIHRDVKPGNILLTVTSTRGQDGKKVKVYHAKLADFGLAKAISAQRLASTTERQCWTPEPVNHNGGDSSVTCQTGSLMYMAPEVYQLGQELLRGEVTPRRAAHMKLVYNEKVDIWSLGIIIWEVFRRGLQEATMRNAEEYAKGMAQGIRPSMPAAWPPPLRDLVTDCWHQTQQSRPTAAEVMKRLEDLRDVCESMDLSLSQCCSIQ